MNFMQKEIAESATGIRERFANGGPLYNDSGEKISDAQARRLFLTGETIEAPNAGAGSFDGVMARLGIHEHDVVEWSSSAGDWTFVVRYKKRWFLAGQSNRYPRHGFAYSMDLRSHDTAEAAKTQDY
jgi:hypothetical protein